MEKRIDKCVRLSRNGGTFLELKGMKMVEIKCRYIQYEDKNTKQLMKSLEITIVEPKGRVWVGKEDVTQQSKSGDYTSTIKKAYRHPHSYRGGGSYNARGNYGGYDISLLELDEPIKSTFACLPSPAFKDQGDGVKGMLTGYGKYLRSVCQTNEHGRSKHHYCSGQKTPTGA